MIKKSKIIAVGSIIVVILSVIVLSIHFSNNGDAHNNHSTVKKNTVSRTKNKKDTNNSEESHGSIGKIAGYSYSERVEKAETYTDYDTPTLNNIFGKVLSTYQQEIADHKYSDNTDYSVGLKIDVKTQTLVISFPIAKKASTSTKQAIAIELLKTAVQQSETVVQNSPTFIVKMNGKEVASILSGEDVVNYF